jgi:hypothetical protein
LSWFFGLYVSLFGVNPIDKAFLLELADNRIIDHIIDCDFDSGFVLRASAMRISIPGRVTYGTRSRILVVVV